MVTGQQGPLLLVCHANRARSPLAARVLAARATELGSRPATQILSSGLFANQGEPLLPEAERTLRAHGLETDDHAARPFSLAEARASRLVLTFERQQLRRVVEQDPALLGRTFTLRELLRLARSRLWEESWNGGPDLAHRLNQLRPRVAAGDDDIGDPAAVRSRASRHLLERVVTDTTAAAPVILGPPHSESTP
jgi:protein-tyrosine-phosphatase